MLVSPANWHLTKDKRQGRVFYKRASYTVPKVGLSRVEKGYCTLDCPPKHSVDYASLIHPTKYEQLTVLALLSLLDRKLRNATKINAMLTAACRGRRRVCFEAGPRGHQRGLDP